MALNWSLQHFTDTAANFTANNPTLLLGQLGIETNGLTTTPKFKVGDGTTAWNSLPYFYGGSLSAQDIANVLSVGNDTGGLSLKMNTGTTYYGATNQTHVTYNAGIELHNTTANKLVNLTDAGLWKVDAVQYMPNLTASRLLSLDSNKYVVNETGTGILTLTGGVISYDTNTYLTTGAAALTYQPLDADLTSWAGVTRASGFDTFTATPSSANLSSLLTDKTGTGVNVFGTSPTFTTDITTPLIIGGTAVGSTIQYKGTTGIGTSTVAAHQFLVGTNGGTTAASIYNSGQVNIGNYATPSDQRLVTIGQDTAWMSFGSWTNTTSEPAIYANQATPSIGNYSIRFSSTATVINSPASTGSTIIMANNGIVHRFWADRSTFGAAFGASTGAIITFNFTNPAHTGQTASTEIPNFKVTGNTKTWANGGGATTIATQRWNYFTANTAATSGGGSLTITNSYGAYFEAATASGTTITNNWGIGTDGNINIVNSSAALYMGDLTPSSTNYALKYTAASELSLNAATTLRFRCGGTIFATGSSTGLTINATSGLSISNTGNDPKITFSRTSGNSHSIQLSTSDYYLYNNTAAEIRYGVTNAGNFYVGAKSALATTATDGFLYVPSCAGTPTGVPTAITGKIPIVCDSTNNKLYIYSGGAWVALN